MRVLFGTLPLYGHFHPLVPVAKVLEEAGHEIAFVCTKSFCTTVEANGFRCFPAGYDGISSLQHMLLPLMEHGLERKQYDWITENVFAGFVARRNTPDVIAVCNDYAPDILVHDSLDFGAYIAAECLDIPHVVAGVPFSLIDPTFLSVASAPLAKLRHKYGLPPDPHLETYYRYLYLAFVPPSFSVLQSLPPTVHFLRSTSFNRSGSETLPDWIADLPDRPVIHASLGTVFNTTTGVYPPIIEGLRDEPITLILTIGRDQDPAQFEPLPANVHVERYIPHSLLLPYCDLVITHGGFNTTMATLDAGLPMVIVPLAADQPINAQRCVELGVAQVIVPQQLTVTAVRDAVREVLQNARYKQQVAQVQAEMRALPGPEYVVSLLERLVVEQGAL